MNVLMLVFNLVPAFPLDGGRIARSIVWRADRRQVPRDARSPAELGQGFAVVLAGIGLWLLISLHSFGGLWLMAMAYLLWQSARGAVAADGADRADRRAFGWPTSWTPSRWRSPPTTPVTQALDEYLPALRLGLVPGRRRRRAPGRDRPPRARPGLGRRRRGMADDERGAGVRRRLELARRQDRPITELLSSESLGRARGADGGRRRRRPARRRHRRPGASSARGRRSGARCA